MRIGIDARFYGVLGKGLGRYTSELIAALEETDIRHEVTVFLRKENVSEYEPKNPRFTKVEADFPWYGWQEQLRYPAFLRAHRLDLVHFCHFNVPLLYRSPFVVTVHDLILTKFPTPRASTLSSAGYALKNLAYRTTISNAVRRARAILAMSEHTKNDILTTFPSVPAGRVVVTYQACGSLFAGGKGAGGWSVGESGTPVASRIPVGPFCLYAGNAYPHKNLDTLIDAFQRFRAGGHADWSLVLVGAKDYFYDRLRREAEAAGLADHVVFFGRASDEELANLYDRASFYVFPSKYEGFGLPPLEAMCRNLPVASSRASCMPEVLGDAALYFDPADPAAIADAMVRVADDADLRRSLAERGRAQSSKYSWKLCAEQTLAAYERALA